MAKLVEILARELREWPLYVYEMRSDRLTNERVTRAEWQAAVDALKAKPEIIGHWKPKENNRSREQFSVLSRRKSEYGGLEGGWEGEKEDGAEYHVLNEYWEWIPVKHAAPEWDGVGLPPVGAVCNCYYKGSHQGRVRVEYIGKNACVLLNLEHDNEQCGMTGHYQFRPIRTPEQIATDERESAINGMLTHDALGGSRRGLAAALYDAGYRKQEPK